MSLHCRLNFIRFKGLGSVFRTVVYLTVPTRASFSTVVLVWLILYLKSGYVQMEVVFVGTQGWVMGLESEVILVSWCRNGKEELVNNFQIFLYDRGLNADLAGYIEKHLESKRLLKSAAAFKKMIRLLEAESSPKCQTDDWLYSSSRSVIHMPSDMFTVRMGQILGSHSGAVEL